MRALSEMYMRSGGTASPHRCDECCNLICTGKHYDCKLYLDAGGVKHWQPSWIACKFMGISALPDVSRKEPEPETAEQMSLFELLPGVQDGR